MTACRSGARICRNYCWSNTNVFLTVCPLALTPHWQPLSSLAVGGHIDAVHQRLFAIFLPFVRVVVGLRRFIITISASGLLPVTRISLPSKLPL